MFKTDHRPFSLFISCYMFFIEVIMPTLACIQEELKIQPSRLIMLVELHIHNKTWKASTVYVLTDRILENGHTYKCTQAGTSGTSKPTFNTTYGATTNDNIGGGTVIWTNDSLFYCDTEDVSITWNSKVYRRNQIAIDTVGAQNIEGNFEGQLLNISNVDRVMGDYIRKNDVRGNEVNIYEVREALLANPLDVRSTWRYMISKATADENSAKISIESLYSDSREAFPNSEVTRNVCIWDYDQDGADPVAADNCGWFTLKSGLLDTVNYPNAVSTSCDKGLRTANGCNAHKNNRARMSPGVPLEPIKGLQ